MKPLNRIVFFSVILSLACISSPAQDKAAENSQSLLPVGSFGQQRERGHPLLNGTYQVGARNYQMFEFFLDPAYGVGEIGGRINVQGPTNFDIQVWIVDYPNLENFINRQAFKSFLNTGRVRLKTFSVSLNPGRYYLVFDNIFSAINGKQVFAQVAVRQFTAPPPREPLDNRDQDQYPEWGEYAEATYRGRRIIRLEKMLDKVMYDECSSSKFDGSGVITEVEYKQEDILSFTLRLPNGRRKNVYINSLRISKPDRGYLYTLINENKKVSVKGCLYGNGGYWHANEIALVR